MLLPRTIRGGPRILQAVASLVLRPLGDSVAEKCAAALPESCLCSRTRRNGEHIYAIIIFLSGRASSSMCTSSSA